MESQTLRAEVSFFLAIVADAWAGRVIQYAFWANDGLTSWTLFVGLVSALAAELLSCIWGEPFNTLMSRVIRRLSIAIRHGGVIPPTHIIVSVL